MCHNGKNVLIIHKIVNIFPLCGILKRNTVLLAAPMR